MGKLVQCYVINKCWSCGLTERFYKMTIRLAMLYGVERWLSMEKKKQVDKAMLIEMCILRRMNIVTLKDRIRNGCIKETMELAAID